MSGKRRAIVLLSGGLDSATCLALARDRGFANYALSFDYGQRHHHELDAARRVAQDLGVAEYRVFTLDLRQIGGSALTSHLEVPKGRSANEIGAGVPVTYVPARNTIFLSIALAWAEVLGAYDIFIGVNALDYSGYPDCRPAFIAAFQALAQKATTIGMTEHGDGEGPSLRVHAPLLHWDKARIIREGVSLGVNYGLTLSCYDPTPAGRPCQACDACRLRANGFEAAGIHDPA